MVIPATERPYIPTTLRPATEADLDLLVELQSNITTHDFYYSFTREQLTELLKK